ncbi:MAG: peptide chain release factor 1, partial [Pseudomonadota bacterium]
DRFDEVEARMGVATDTDEIIALSKEHSDLKPVVEKVRELISARSGLAEAEEMMAGEDEEMAELAKEEALELKAKLPDLEQEVQLLLLPKDVDDNANIVLEIRAGTGGDEAALFAGDLFRMYQRYTSLQGWKLDLVSVAEGDVGGYKEIVANVEGDGAFGRLKFESGTHRVQRVPATESGGRIHTSAATVAVLPAPKDIQIEIRQQDLRIDTFRASGSGGQHVNKTDSAVRITHLPTGIVTTSSEKSQHVNRDKAMEQLKIKLYEQERKAIDDERSESRKLQLGSGDRSEKIRTYNYPENRVTDHRINLTLYSLDKIIAGDKLDDVVTALIADQQSRLLAAMDDADA